MIPTTPQLEGRAAIDAAQAFPTITDTERTHSMSMRETITAEVEAWRAGIQDVPTSATHIMDYISAHWESILRPWFVATMGALPTTAEIAANAHLLQFPATLTASNRQAFQWKGRTEFEGWLDVTTWTHHIRQAIPEPTAPHQPPAPRPQQRSKGCTCSPMHLRYHTPDPVCPFHCPPAGPVRDWEGP